MIATLDLEDIRRQNDLAEVASRYVDLSPAGTGRMKACCPFHDERTPSFYVYADQHFKCFGCGQSGDVFQFIQSILKVSFVEAKRFLSGQPSEIPVAAPSFRNVPREVPKSNLADEVKRAGIIPIAGSPGEKYLQKRGLTKATMQAGRVRFARNWQRRASVVFPIIGPDLRIVALQGRAICGSAKITIGPKENGVFVCGEAWSSPELAVCEGPIDALSFFQLFGIPAIAVCGSSPIPEWILDRYGGTLLLTSDNDKENRQGERPGEKAALQWAAQSEAKGIQHRRVRPVLKDFNLDLIQSLKP